MNQHKEDYLIITTSGLALRRQCLAMPVVGFQRGMDLWGDHVAFCQITLTSCYVQTGEDEQLFRSVITVATTPAQVFTGIGLTCEAADDAAAQSALTVLLSNNSTAEVCFYASLCKPLDIKHFCPVFTCASVGISYESVCVCHTPVGTALKWPHISS